MIKRYLPNYLTAIKCRFNFVSPTCLSVCCPIHKDQNPSMSANLVKTAWLWKCHACGVGGTVIDLHARLNKRDPETQYPLICKEVAEIVRMETTGTMNLHEVDADTAEASEKAPLSEQHLDALTLPWRKELWENSALRNKFAADLGLPTILLQHIATRCLNGTMGIVPRGFHWISKNGEQCELREPRLVYIGLGYYKIRAPFGDNRRPRFMMCGHQILPWLSELLIRDITTVKEVHVHESESSALALIASGFWSANNSSIVIATSGAGGFKANWCPLFTGRTVHLWPDADDAGYRFVNRTASMLHGIAGKIFIRAWNHSFNHS